MTTPERPADEASPPTLFARGARGLQTLEEWLVAGSILLIATLTIINVGMRSLLGESLAAAEELSQFAIICVTFVGLSYAASQGRHIRMTALYDQLSTRGRKGLMIVITASTAALMFLLAVYSVRYLVTVAELGSVSPVLQVPLAAVYAIVPIGFVLSGIQYGLALLQNLVRPEVYIACNLRDEYEPATSPDAL